jgi:hypothetical protein
MFKPLRCHDAPPIRPTCSFAQGDAARHNILKQGLISSATRDQQWQRERQDIAKPDY